MSGLIIPDVPKVRREAQPVPVLIISENGYSKRKDVHTGLRAILRCVADYDAGGDTRIFFAVIVNILEASGTTLPFVSEYVRSPDPL